MERGRPPCLACVGFCSFSTLFFLYLYRFICVAGVSTRFFGWFFRVTKYVCCGIRVVLKTVDLYIFNVYSSVWRLTSIYNG